MLIIISDSNTDVVFIFEKESRYSILNNIVCFSLLEKISPNHTFICAIHPQHHQDCLPRCQTWLLQKIHSVVEAPHLRWKKWRFTIEEEYNQPEFGTDLAITTHDEITHSFLEFGMLQPVADPFDQIGIHHCFTKFLL